MLTKRNLFFVLISAQIIVLANLAYTGFKMYSYISTGRGLVDVTSKFESIDGKDRKILVLGDSLAYGVGTSSPKNSFAGQLATRFPEYDVFNRSVVGHSTKELDQQIEARIENDSFDKIFIMIGGNDIFRFGTDINRSADNLKSIAEKAAKRSDNVFLITTPDFRNVSLIPWFSRTFYSGRSEVLHETAIQSASSTEKINYVDTYQVDAEEYKKLEAEDGFHLNDDGISRLLDLIIEAS